MENKTIANFNLLVKTLGESVQITAPAGGYLAGVLTTPEKLQKFVDDLKRDKISRFAFGPTKIYIRVVEEDDWEKDQGIEKAEKVMESELQALKDSMSGIIKPNNKIIVPK